MSIFLSASERHLATAVSRLVVCNPFVPEAWVIEREILGREYHAVDRPGFFDWQQAETNNNVVAIARRVEALARELRARLERGAAASDEELKLYEDLVLYHLYEPHRVVFDDLIRDSMATGSAIPARAWDEFRAEFRHYLLGLPHRLPSAYEAPHIYAGFFQLRRAVYWIHRYILGSSAPIQRLRAAVWQSIFTHDLRRYSRSLFRHMADITLLVTGPSGTGKELVARAVGLSRFHAFDERTRAFETDFTRSFHPVNLSALPSTLIESELFGHVKGAFTGAVNDRKGLFEECGEHGSVFLDEIGELHPTLQVKLLRVLEAREMQRVGEARLRRFRGKVIAATNRDLAEERRLGRFRDDLFYRLCSDMIRTPALREQLQDRPDDLALLVGRIAGRIAGDAAEALTDDVLGWIGRHLPEHAWPGNVRELEQCVRNVMIRRSYLPPTPTAAEGDPVQHLGEAFAKGAMTMDEVERAYATMVFVKAGGYREAGRRLGLDWRTLKAKIEPRLLERLRGTRAGTEDASAARAVSPTTAAAPAASAASPLSGPRVRRARRTR